MAGRSKAMVATNVFGVGIDKPDVRNGLNFGMSGSMVSYYQEIGRPGRGGQLATATLLWCASDRGKQIGIHRGAYNQGLGQDEIRQVAEFVEATSRKDVWNLLHRKLQPKFLKVSNPDSMYPIYGVTTDGEKVLRNEIKAMLNV